MRAYLEADERFCLICNARLNDIHSLYDLGIKEHCLCQTCASHFLFHKKIYRIENREWHVLYEYDVFLERLFFRYKEQRDRLLARVFLEPVLPKTFKKFTVCGLCSSTQKRYQRGFEPLLEMFTVYDIDIRSPLYKNRDHKQSQLSKKERHQISSIIQRKEHYPLPKKEILLVDDVCTTGSTMNRALELFDAKTVFLVAAHPLWIQKHQEMTVEKKSLFW